MASIIAIVELCSEVIKYVNETGATTGEMRLREEVRSCKFILEQLKDATDDTNKAKISSDAIEASRTPLCQLGIALGDIRAKFEPVRKWPFDEKEVEKFISTIEHEKNLLARAMQCETPNEMDLNPPLRYLLRTRPDQLNMIHPSLDPADTILIEKVCLVLRANSKNIRRLITKVWIERRQERVDIICDNGDFTNTSPQVMAYEVMIKDSNVMVEPLLDPQIRSRVNNEVKAWRELSVEHGIPFPGRTDLRVTQKRQIKLRGKITPPSKCTRV